MGAKREAVGLTAMHRLTHLTFIALMMGLVLAQACMEEKGNKGPTPIEQMLAADSAYRAQTGDSVNGQHIAFDYENLNRVVWQKPDMLVERLGNLRGKTVVEVGSGTGFFTRRLARKAKRVIALDIDPGMLIVLDSVNRIQLDTAAYARVDPRLVPADDPNLGIEEADAALVVNTFMYIQDGAGYLKHLAAGLRPGSPVLIVDFKGESTPVGPPVASRVPRATVEQALRDAGFTGIESDDLTLDYQYIVRGRVPERKED